METLDRWGPGQKFASPFQVSTSYRGFRTCSRALGFGSWDASLLPALPPYPKQSIASPVWTSFGVIAPLDFSRRGEGHVGLLGAQLGWDPAAGCSGSRNIYRNSFYSNCKSSAATQCPTKADIQIPTIRGPCRVLKNRTSPAGPTNLKSKGGLMQNAPSKRSTLKPRNQGVSSGRLCRDMGKNSFGRLWLLWRSQ